jgi:hypothetical protein
MTVPPQTRHRWTVTNASLLALTLGLTACPGGGDPPPDPNAPILTRASKSSAIAISDDDKYTIQTNPENDSITVIKTSDNSKVLEFPVGDEPVSVVIHPDNTTAFVANRAAGTVVKIKDYFTTPSIVGTANVGSEPTGIALSPRGDKLVVAEFAESRVSLVNTKDMTVSAFTPVKNPRAVAVTNNGDKSDTDEKVVITEFYGRITGAEATDSSRTGAVRIFNLSGLSGAGEVLFPPAPVGTFEPALVPNVQAKTSQASPNQLASVAVVGDKFFVTAVAAAPDNAPFFTQNVFPFLLIGQISSSSKVATISLADAIESQVAAGATRNFMADLYDLAPVSDSIIYLLGRGADAVQRVSLAGTNVELGAAGVKQIDLLGAGGDPAKPQCQNPIGIVARHDSNNLFVNCWVSRATVNISVASQIVVARVPAAPIAEGEKDVNKGRRDYFTARARWSKEVWSSCASCHPDGLSDNITWSFPAGPRQSTSMDGTFSHGSGAQKQRILNWTGIFDEVHDFERNTRVVSGGLGAVTTGDCSSLAGEVRLNLNPNNVGVVPPAVDDLNGLNTTLLKPVKEVQDGIGSPKSCVTDFDSIENFVKTIRPPQKPRTLNAASVTNGRVVFEAGNCQSCHGGAGWTVSRRFFTPSNQKNTDLATLSVSLPGHTKMIENEQNPAGGSVGPNQIACVLRPVGTFGALNEADTSLEVKQDSGGAIGGPAQGKFAGYNVPSLYGLSVGAPFLHHGQAVTLTDLLGNPRWAAHLKAGKADFAPSAVQLVDLETFLLSIDARTPEIALPANADFCPVN